VSDPIPGRSLVTRRAVRELVRTAVVSSYGVTGFASGGPVRRTLERLGLAHPGLRVEIEPELVVHLRLTVAYGLPIAEVARQVESSVRWTLRHAIGREPDEVTIRIGQLVHQQRIGGIADAATSTGSAATHEPGPSDLAASGTDVA
jgi:uncharacterized alkaline shock family protein YloU